MSETKYAIQRNADRRYLERFSMLNTVARWCDDDADALRFPSMTEATMEALQRMPKGSDWIVVPVEAEKAEGAQR